MPDEVKIYPDAETLAQAAAEHIVARAEEAIAARGRFAVALAGGSTPRAAYARLAAGDLAARLDWSRVHVFWGDERCAPPDHPDSNSLMAREAWLDHVPIPPGNVHRVPAELAPQAAAEMYESTLRAFFGETPRFDLILLGMGEDGHTASLFPGVAALREQAHWTAAVYVVKLNAWRVTLTPAAINAAAEIVFLVSGAGKAERLRDVLRGPYQPDVFPAQIVRPTDGGLLWLVDQAAAGQLT